MKNEAYAFHIACVGEPGEEVLRCSLSFNNNTRAYHDALAAVQEAGLPVADQHIGIGLSFDLSAQDFAQAKAQLRGLDLLVSDPRQISVEMRNGYREMCCSPLEAVSNAYRNVLTPMMVL